MIINTQQEEEKSFTDKYIRQNKYFAQILLLSILVILVIVMSATSEYFFAWKNIRNILDQCSVYLILSIGMTFVIASGGVDLSVGSIAGLSGAVMAVLMKAGLPVATAIVLGLVTGILVGIANGAIVSYLKINPLITTLAMMTITRGMALVLTGGVSIYGFAQSFKWWGSGSIGAFNPPILLSLLFTIVGLFLLSKTLWGKYSISLGGNPEALRRMGVNTKLYRISIYAVSGFCAALAGMIMAARLNSAAPLAGAGYEMDAIAAVVLGGGSLNGGTGSIMGTFIACLTLAVMRNGLTLLAVPTYYQQVITGTIILVAIIVAQIRNRKDKESE